MRRTQRFAADGRSRKTRQPGCRVLYSSTWRDRKFFTPTRSEIPLNPKIEGHCLLVCEGVCRGQERWVHTKQRSRRTGPVLVEVGPENFPAKRQIFHRRPTGPETKLIDVEIRIAGRGGICTSVAPTEQGIAGDRITIGVLGDIVVAYE